MSNLMHDIIKIQLSRAGYLPDYPPHLISKSEMCAGILTLSAEVPSIVADTYPRPQDVPSSIVTAYRELMAKLEVELEVFRQSEDPDAELPNWVYSYALGVVIGPNSDVIDRHNGLVLIGEDNSYDEFTPAAYDKCLQASKRWLAKYGLTDRPPTIFLEPHVIKYFRLLNSV